ncbi:MAG: rhomboid family intramembrane serine protease [Caldilineaceae bacterium]
MDQFQATPTQPSTTQSTVDAERRIAERLQQAKQMVVTHAMILGSLVALLWLVEVADQLFWQQSLDFLGIQPRTQGGLEHILFAPFLHRGFSHLLANTLPFLLLGWFVMLRGVGEFILVSLIAGLISGAGIWLFGAPDTIHIGMSGVIFGYLGFLLGRGYFERSAIAIGLAFLVGLLYGSMIWGVFPIQPNISWQGHLFGLLGGGIAAYLLAKRPEVRSKPGPG